MSLYHTTHWASQLLGAIRKEIAVRKASDKLNPKVFVAPDAYEALVKHIDGMFDVQPETDDYGTPLPREALIEHLMIDGCAVIEVSHLDPGMAMVVNGNYAKKFEDEWERKDATKDAEVSRRGVPGDTPGEGQPEDH